MCIEFEIDVNWKLLINSCTDLQSKIEKFELCGGDTLKAIIRYIAIKPDELYKVLGRNPERMLSIMLHIRLKVIANTC